MLRRPHLRPPLLHAIFYQARDSVALIEFRDNPEDNVVGIGRSIC